MNLAPSNALAWRTLGKILAQHGGALEAERADEALRNALTLEPGWTDLRELRDKLGRRRAAGATQQRRGRATVPSDMARSLYQQAEEWIRVGDPVGLGRELLDQALADSPGFVAAAVSSYALSGKLPPATLEALKDDGPALWALAAGVRKLGQTGKKTASADDVEALVRPLIDRAVALDVQEARFTRAIARGAAGDRAGALADLTAYVAREPNPEHLAEARALRAEIEDRAGPRGDAQPSPHLLARIRLLEDKPDWALRALGGPCARDVPADRLVALGLVNEYADRLSAARVCYELAANAGGAFAAAGLVRAANLDARLPEAELRKADRRTLGRGGRGEDRRRRVGAGAARRGRGRRDHRAGAHRARAGARGRHHDRRRSLGRRRPRRPEAPVGCAARGRRRPPRPPPDVLAVGDPGDRAWAWACSRAGAGAAARSPARSAAAPRCFPTWPSAVGELRHDVLKHRASVLGSARGRGRAARRDRPHDDGTAADVGGGRDDLRSPDAGGERPRRHAARARARAECSARCTAISPAPRPCSRARARQRRAGGDRRAPARSTRRRAGGVAAARTAHPPRRRDAVGLDRVGRSVGAAAPAAAGRRPRCRSPIWPSTSRSSTTRWPPSS